MVAGCSNVNAHESNLMKERNGLYEKTETFLFATYRKNHIYRKCKAVQKCQKALEYGVSGYMQTRGFGRLLYGQIV